MKAQHTPGPWGRNIPPATKYPTIFAGKAPNHSHVAHVLSGSLTGVSAEEAEGNASLIAAAPELLAALEKHVAAMDAHGFADPHSEVNGGDVVDSIASALPRLRELLVRARGGA